MRVEYQATIYEFDTDNFLYYLSKGETFYTDYYELTVKKTTEQDMLVSKFIL